MPSEVTSEILPDDPELSGLAEAVRTSAADDAGDDDLDGYTNIEEYLSCIVGEGDC